MCGRALHGFYSHRWLQSDNLNYDTEHMLLEPDTLLSEDIHFSSHWCWQRQRWRYWHWHSAMTGHGLDLLHQYSTGLQRSQLATTKWSPPIWLKSTLLSVFVLFCHEIMNCLWRYKHTVTSVWIHWMRDSPCFLTWLYKKCTCSYPFCLGGGKCVWFVTIWMWVLQEGLWNK